MFLRYLHNFCFCRPFEFLRISYYYYYKQVYNYVFLLYLVFCQNVENIMIAIVIAKYIVWRITSYTRLARSVGRSIDRSVGRSFGRTFGQSENIMQANGEHLKDSATRLLVLVNVDTSATLDNIKYPVLFCDIICD